ncbi:DUF4838 domain-containing protein [Sphingobacterium sp. UBA6645]|uniref:DUF4838 domain-containing protein n=1 Tax=Sphingobacterium sp. UBA6645 TaxID=1947511 RepID=UPI0026005A09|nr:DUF4838 domain-containing protein [Sphingobacterium sp. UBA6645]
MLLFNIIFSCFIMLFTSCESDFYGLDANAYVLTAEQDAASEQWQEYLFNHLSKRTSKKDLFSRAEDNRNFPANHKQIHVEIAADLNNDYCIQHTKDKLHIRVKTKAIATWMSYQLIESLGQVKKEIKTDDLPPAYLTFTNQCKDFDFIYREPHYAPNTNVEYAALLGTNNLDTEWGIWGHNITRIIQDAPGVWAEVNGKITQEQYCFSSDTLYNQLKEYIQDNFSDKPEEGMKFMIAPNDNLLSCTCDRCQAAGNTDKNAAPAVVLLINKLAKQFRQHQFFTIRYHSVNEPPAYAFEDNAGLFFSTIELPKITNFKDNSKFQSFIDEIEAWKSKTKTIYLWDYSSNFDDYLTPLPSLNVLKAQLQGFKEEGVEGIFLNAAGYDYSSFDDLKTYVAAALMINTELEIDKLTKAYLKKFYPKSHQLLADYYLQLEDDFATKAKPYSLYAGFPEVKSSYFNASNFLSLNESLQKVLPKTKGYEREALEKLLAAFRYTSLQIAYSNGLNKGGAFEVVDQHVRPNRFANTLMKQLKKDVDDGKLKVFKESNGDLGDYLAQWNAYAGKLQKPNQLKSTKLLSVVSNENDVLDKTPLADGVLGFDNDFHQGWLTASKTMTLILEEGAFDQMKEMKLRFLKNERHQYGAPSKVEVLQGGKVIFRADIVDTKEGDSVYTLTIPLEKFEANIVSEIKISTSNPQLSRLGLDEVQVFN